MTVARGSATRAEARARHPSASWAPDHTRLRRRLADQLAAQGHPRPTFGATLLGVRGLLGMDRSTFAAAIGVDEARLLALEAGELGLRHEPGPGQATRVVVDRMTRSSDPVTDRPLPAPDGGEMRRS